MSLDVTVTCHYYLTLLDDTTKCHKMSLLDVKGRCHSIYWNIREFDHIKASYFNYPGNAVILKPSEISPATAKAMADLIPKYLDPQCVKVMIMYGLMKTVRYNKYSLLNDGDNWPFIAPSLTIKGCVCL